MLAGVLLTSTGCKKFLDVNHDPNNPLTATEGLILTPVEITTGTQVFGGFTGTVNAFWMQQVSLNQPSPDNENYDILPQDVDNTWTTYLYPNTFENLTNMINQAEAAGHGYYAAIGKALFAQSLAIATDMWNQVPYSQALQINTFKNPKYDSQESIYGAIQGLLDSAAYYASQPAPPKGVSVPGNDDLIYGEIWHSGRSTSIC